MSFVNKVNGDNRTFGEVCQSIFTYALQSGLGSDRIDMVFDVYREESIKAAEREKRSQDTGIVYGSIAAGQRVQQWRRRLRSSTSKNALINFLVESWKCEPYPEKLGDKVMYVTCDEKCSGLQNPVSVSLTS